MILFNWIRLRWPIQRLSRKDREVWLRRDEVLRLLEALRSELNKKPIDERRLD